MAILGTFDYVAVVPADPSERSRPWPARVRPGGIWTRRDVIPPLVGFEPRLHFEDAGLTPNGGWNEGRWVPRVLRARVVLTGQDRSSVASASFHVDMGVVRRLEGGDVIHLTRTSSAGLALSVIRGETLVVAVGSVCSVPLGKDVVARRPHELMEAVSELFREYTPKHAFRPEHPFREEPIEIIVEGKRHLSCGGSFEEAPYRVFVVRGSIPVLDGADECAAISHVEMFSDACANASALLLSDGRIDIQKW